MTLNVNYHIIYLLIAIIFIVIISIIFIDITSITYGQKIENKNSFIKGYIIINNLTSPIYNSTIIIYIEDITFQDAPAKLIRKEFFKDINFDLKNKSIVKFSINGTVPNTNSIYTIRVDIDSNNDSILNHGDFISSNLHLISPKMGIGYTDPLHINMTKI